MNKLITIGLIVIAIFLLLKNKKHYNWRTRKKYMEMIYVVFNDQNNPLEVQNVAKEFYEHQCK